MKLKFFFERVKEFVRIEGFSVEFTTDYQAINTKSLKDIGVANESVRNPDYYAGFWGNFKWTRIIRGFLKNIDPTLPVYYLSEEFDDVLSDLKYQHRKHVETTIEKNEKSMKKAIGLLSQNMENLKKGIYNQMERIENIKNRIDTISKDVEEKQKLKGQVETDREVIIGIQKSLDFGFDKKMEEVV